MKSVAFYTLGCKLNFSETSSIARMFEEKGFRKTKFEEGADVYVINTCSVTDHADKKCRKVVKEALRHAPHAFVAIIGCYAQLKPQEIAEIPGVDAVLGASEKFRLLELLDSFDKREKASVFASDITVADRFVSSYSAGDRTRSFLKVQDGCDYSCAFCTIPLARGGSRSGTVESIVAEAEKIAAGGMKEVVLTGVNIGDFGIRDGKRTDRLIDLLKALDCTKGRNRFRISSIEPNLLSDEIIEFVAESEKFMPHFHIPLQSGSNKILKRMRRRYLRELYVARVEKIKSVMPDCCIGVDVITGFPGETEEDFLETYRFLNDLDVSYLHAFTYSERPDTHAVTMSGKVPYQERQRRTKMLHILSEKKKRYFYEGQLGKVRSVLLEQDVEGGFMHGFTDNYVRVAVPYDPLLINEIKTMRLKAFSEKGFVTAEEVYAPIPVG